MRTERAPSRNDLTSLVRETADGLEHLVRDHLQLARIELVADLKRMLRDAAGVVACLVVVLLGYLLSMVALSIAISGALGPWGAFLLVGGAHLVGGGLGIYIAATRLKKARAETLEESREELGRSVAMAGELTRAATQEGE
jgi:hypothetical protein